MKPDCNINMKELTNIVDGMLAEKNELGRQAFNHMTETDMGGGTPVDKRKLAVQQEGNQESVLALAQLIQYTSHDSDEKVFKAATAMVAALDFVEKILDEGSGKIDPQLERELRNALL